MELTREEKQLKEAMKILLRDGRTGRLFNAAKARYLALITNSRVSNLAHELDGIDWTNNYQNDIKQIDQIIK